jgi:hypothetical protein
MTLSDPTDTQPAVKQARKRGRSAEEKRQQSEERVRRHRSTTAGTAQADTVRERDRLAKQRSRASKENTPPPSQQESTPSREATTAVPSPQLKRRPMTAVPAAVSGQRHVQPLAAMRTPASRRSDAPMPAAMTDSSACKGAALGIPPPADRVGGTHQSLGLDNEKALDAVYYREASLPIYHIHSYLHIQLCVIVFE